MTVPTRSGWRRKWSGSDSEGDVWNLEIDTDCFTDNDPFVVSLFVDTTSGETRAQEIALATLSSEQARELSASLLREADNTDANNARISQYRKAASS